MNIKTQIPNELESAVKGGYVTCSAQIIDYLSGLTQEDINKLVLQNLSIPIFEVSTNYIEVGDSVTVTFVFSSDIDTNVILTNSENDESLDIQLEKSGNRYSKSKNINLSRNYESSITYTAEFVNIGQLISKTINFVYPIYYGSISTNSVRDLYNLISNQEGNGDIIKTIIKPDTFTIDFQNSEEPRYIYFVVPKNTQFNHDEAKLDNFLGFPIEPPHIDNINDVEYKFYFSSTTHDADVYNITNV